MIDVRNSDILLIEPGPLRQHKAGAAVRLPLAPLCLAAYLEEYSSFTGRISVLDMRLDSLEKDFFQNARIIGISAMTGLQVHYGLLAARMARKNNPHAVIVWGGIHPTLLPEETLRSDYVDAVVAGEGEETFRELAEALFAGRSFAGIKGAYCKHSAKVTRGDARPFVDMNKLPMPAYHLVDPSRYRGIQYQFDYQSSRGCPFRCDFCYNTAFSGRKWRCKTPRKVLSELRALHGRYNVKCFALVDDEFFIDIRRLEVIVDDLLRDPIGAEFTASCRLDIVKRIPVDLLRKLKQAGFRCIYFGAESGSDEMLSSMHKGIRSADILDGAARTASVGIRPVLSFMAGFPTETFEQMGQTLSLITKVKRMHDLITINGIFPYSPYPGTRMYEEAIGRGLVAPDSLDEWGEWNFQYTPDNPWLESKKKRAMRTAFYIVRFQYYLAMYYDRNPNALMRLTVALVSAPLRISAAIRWRLGWFAWAFEWDLFAVAAQKTFGYL